MDELNLDKHIQKEADLSASFFFHQRALQRTIDNREGTRWTCPTTLVRKWFGARMDEIARTE